MLKQGAHIFPHYPTYDGIHIHSGLIQPEVEVSKPENLVESGGNVSWNWKFKGFSIDSHKFKHNQLNK